MPDAPLEPADRRDVDDRPGPRGRHRAGRGARPVERPVEVDGEHLAPFVVGQPDQRVERCRHRALRALVELALHPVRDPARVRDRRDPRVVDPDVDRAERRLDLGQRGVDGRRRRRRRPGRRSRRRASRSARPRPGRRRAPRRCAPSSASRTHDRLADPGAAAGDDGDPTVEPSAHATYPSVCSARSSAARKPSISASPTSARDQEVAERHLVVALVDQREHEVDDLLAVGRCMRVR